MKKVRISVILISALALSACGKGPVLELDPELATYVTQFENEGQGTGSKVRVVNLIARFGELDNPRSNGICEIEEGETPRIIISRAKWNRMSAQKREGLMFHELGHCVLGREHKDGEIHDGVPASLMNPYSIDSYTYAEYRGYYVKELFTGRGEISKEE